MRYEHDVMIDAARCIGGIAPQQPLRSRMGGRA